MLLEDVVLEFWLPDVVACILQDLEDELEVLVDVLDCDVRALLNCLCFIGVIHGGHLFIEIVLLSVNDDSNNQDSKNKDDGFDILFILILLAIDIMNA